MNAHVVSYPSLQSRLIARRRARAFFLGTTTQHVGRSSLALEIFRAAISLAGIAAWGAVVVLLAA